jgi:hypothetical protein
MPNTSGAWAGSSRLAAVRLILTEGLGVGSRVRAAPASPGLVSRRAQHAQAPKDAVAVARLRAAGFIPLGVTNVSELCMWYESNNRVYGRTRNPYHLHRIVGGSSGGEGSIIGAGASPCGLGSDIGARATPQHMQTTRASA